jgi:hypothetical protein
MTQGSDTRSLEERRAELEALRRELGLVGMIRYLQQISPGSGDYTAERAELQRGLTVEDVIASIEKRQAERDTAQGS